MKKIDSLDPLHALFASPELLRTLRFLTFNEDSFFTKDDLSKLLTIKKTSLTKVLKQLEQSELIRTSRRGRNIRYRIDSKHQLFEQLADFVRYDHEANKKKIKSLFKSEAGVSGLVLSGRFTGNSRAEADLIVITKEGESKKLLQAIQALGYQAGFEPSYLALTPDEFEYRRDMNDRVVRNVVDFDHYKVF